MTNLDPLLSLTDTVESDITLEFNDGLIDISGLQNIPYTKIVRIIGHASLQSLDGLEGLSGAMDQITIPINDVLVDISALSNIVSVKDLSVVNNPQLNDCCGVAQLLAADTPPLSVNISDNLADCVSANAILLACGFPACNGDITFTSQSELDSWITCDTLFGNLQITGSDIVDLTPLNGLVAVTGNVNINNCSNLSSLNGLNQLSSD